MPWEGFIPCGENVLHVGTRLASKWLAWAVAAVCLIPLLQGPGWAGVPELDREGIFCAYYALCGETPEDGDIEDLCWALQSPTFSAFKPAEMFSGNSLRRARDRLNGRIRRIDANSLFLWNIEGRLHRKSPERAGFQPAAWEPDLPRATSYIGAEIPPERLRQLRSALKDLPLVVPEEASGKMSRLGVLLRPQRVENRFQTRNIALEDVFLPIRCVVFVPVAIQPSPNPDAPVIPIPR